MTVTAASKKTFEGLVGDHWDIAVKGTEPGDKVQVEVAVPGDDTFKVATGVVPGGHAATFALDRPGEFSATVTVNGKTEVEGFKATAIESATRPTMASPTAPA